MFWAQTFSYHDLETVFLLVVRLYEFATESLWSIGSTFFSATQLRARM